MRALIAFLLIAAAAVTLALLFRLNTGYVLFVAPPYRVELSQNAFIIISVLAFLALYALIRAGVRLAKLPEEVREGRRRRQFERFRGKQDAAVVALLEGRHGKARQFAQEALAIPHSSPVAALVGARAALETRDYTAAAAMLDRPDTHATNLAVPRLMLEAEIALERGRPVDALARLAELRREAGLHTAAQRLELRALNAAGRPGEIPALVDQLVKRKVYDSGQGELLRASAHAEALASFAHDAAGLRAYWARVPDNDRLQPKVARAAAKSYLQLGSDREAADILAKSLERNWDSRLALLYAECRAARCNAPARNRRALARQAQPGRVAPVRARPAVRTPTAMGQGADVPRGEPRARQSLARACGARRNACETRSARRSERASVRRAEACARRTGAYGEHGSEP